MDPKDLPGGRYVAIFRYPKPSRGTKIPLFEKGVRTSETEDEYRVGLGHAVRLFPTRWAIVLGFWVGLVPGETEDEKLHNVLQGRDIEDDPENVREYYQ